MMFELGLVCPESSVQDISDALEALDALSVSVEDADAQSDAERALFGEPGMPPPKEAWQRSKVVALFAKEALALDAERLLLVQDFFANCQSLGVHHVEDQDWVTLTQSQFQPVEITNDFWIVPTWHEPPKEAKRFIRLDPGLAFGTGTHPTTRMCLRWIASHLQQQQQQQQQMQQQLQPSLRVLDYGCGSGILAIAAALHGAQHLFGDLLKVGFTLTQILVFHLVELTRNHFELRGQSPFGVVQAVFDPALHPFGQHRVIEQHDVDFEDGGQFGGGISGQVVMQMLQF